MGNEANPLARPLIIGDVCQKCGIAFSSGVFYITIKQTGKTVRQASRDVCLGCFGAMFLDSPEFLKGMAKILLEAANKTEEDPGADKPAPGPSE